MHTDPTPAASASAIQPGIRVPVNPGISVAAARVRSRASPGRAGAGPWPPLAAWLR